jgi:hypothetical protein
MAPRPVRVAAVWQARRAPTGVGRPAAHAGSTQDVRRVEGAGASRRVRASHRVRSAWLELVAAVGQCACGYAFTPAGANASSAVCAILVSARRPCADAAEAGRFLSDCHTGPGCNRSMVDAARARQ